MAYFSSIVNDSPLAVKKSSKNDKDPKMTLSQHQMKNNVESALVASTITCNTKSNLKFSEKECKLCFEQFSSDQLFPMPRCKHTCCITCASKYFTAQITQHAITECVCPFCKQPNFDQTHDNNDFSEYFTNLNNVLQNIIPEETQKIFQRKLRENTNVKICIYCSSQLKTKPVKEEFGSKLLLCNDCNIQFCLYCFKPVSMKLEIF